MSPSRYLHLYNVVIRRTRRLKCMPLGRRVNVSPPLHYKNIGKHELEPSRDRDFSLSNPYNSAKIHDAHTLQRPREKFPSPSSLVRITANLYFRPWPRPASIVFYTRAWKLYRARRCQRGLAIFESVRAIRIRALRWPDNENWPTRKTIARQGADNASLLPFRVVLQRAANREFGGREETLEGGTS